MKQKPIKGIKAFRVEQLFFAIVVSLMLSCDDNKQVEAPTDFKAFYTSVDGERLRDGSYVVSQAGEKTFMLSESGKSTPILVSSQDFPGVLKVTKHLQTDITRVTGVAPEIMYDVQGKDILNVVIIGTIGKSPLIDQLIENNKIDETELKGKREKFILQTVSEPFKGVDKALVIAGSDKRGTIYGMYDLSKEIGVSPWYWWADVPVKTHPALYVKEGKYTLGEPAVKYRGIFINDEAPALSEWVFEKFGQFNHEFYEKVYELILRNKGNYLWPAMWGRSLYDDDSLSAPLADMYGVVIGTSHHEPLMRSHVEWSRYGKGDWNYEKNETVLRDFWREGIKRMGDNESIVTIGMRGDGDEAMTEGTAITLLERIVKDQRDIISEVTGKRAEEVPQVWALYKEVQDYYDKGMRVPDDVTLLLCDDNWGNIRKLPQRDENVHTGGYGIYYHFDYVGGPRSYKWLNTVQNEKTWEQMHLAYEYNAREIWVVNVGDIKPMEFPISFFLDYAWAPDKINAEDLNDYSIEWARQQFGDKYSVEIAEILDLYTKYNSRRKPEMLSEDIYSLTNYREADNVVKDYMTLVEKVNEISGQLDEEYSSAFFQLVEYPVKACANLNQMYVTLGKNYLYGMQKRSLTNEMADRVKTLFDYDAELTDQYHGLMGGRWNHMMAQLHIGYKSWSEPQKRIMPEVQRIEIQTSPSMGISAEGVDKWWPESKEKIVLPVYNPWSEKRYVEIFNQGDGAFDFNINTHSNWIIVEPASGKVTDQERLFVSIDWDKAPTGEQQASLMVENSLGESVEVLINTIKPDMSDQVSGFVEGGGYVSFDAVNYTRKTENDNFKWVNIPNLGRTSSSITTMPVTSASRDNFTDDACLEYDFYVFEGRKVDINVFVSPTLNFHFNKGLRYAVSVDDREPVVVNIHEFEKYPGWWDRIVGDNINITRSQHTIKDPGKHTLKIFPVDPGIVFQKIVIDWGGVKRNYLGPPQNEYVE